MFRAAKNELARMQPTPGFAWWTGDDVVIDAPITDPGNESSIRCHVAYGSTSPARTRPVQGAGLPSPESGARRAG